MTMVIARPRALWPWLVLWLVLALGAALVQLGCKTHPPPIVAPPTLRTVGVSVTSGATPVDGATVTLDDLGAPHVGTTNADGFALLTLVPATLSASHLTITASGYQPYSQHVDLDPGHITLAATLTVIPPDPPRQVRGQLTAQYRALTYPDGSRFIWRGITAFGLNAMVSSGHEAEAVAWMTAARASGFSVVRVLVMLPQGWFTWDADFTPDDGLAALPRTLARAREADLYVHVTVLANTAAIPDADFASYIERAGVICATTDNCAVVEAANEPYHASQADPVHDPVHLAAWVARVPAPIPTALGTPANDGDGATMAAGSTITIHLDRGRDRWNRVRRVRELETTSAATGRYVIDSEPMGADETEQPGRRDTDPAAFFGQGALSRIFAVGSTFHCEACLQTVPLGPVQRACAEAFLDGTRIVPDDVTLTFQNAGWSASPVKAFRVGDPALVPNTAVRAYSGLSSTHNVLALVGVAGDPGVEWHGGWRPAGMLTDRDALQIWTLRHEEAQ
ncbi:MAG: carboxypeptidase-like regulatory domain-containing protein [Acidobacteria bacterium]|nr:carboxypeptidase-like regulatory domain-containing protein [Acidobacteriota bacterium]